MSDTFSPGGALRDAEILYVDGDSHRRDTMRRLLCSLGVKGVQLANDAQEAMEVFRSAPLSILLTEYALPKLDGLALIRSIRHQAHFPKALMPALLICDAVGPELASRAQLAGVHHILVRPLSNVRLYERLDWSLRDPRPFGLEKGYYVIQRPPKGKTA